MLPTLLTVTEAAAAMRMSKEFVRSLVRRKILRHARAGRSIRIYEDSVADYLRGVTVERSPRVKSSAVNVNGFKFLRRGGFVPSAHSPPGARPADPGVHSVA